MTYLLIHGGGSTARYWDRVVPLLAGPSLTIDMPGRNGKPADLATLSLDDEVASILTDVAASGAAGPFTIVAHSSGGLVVPGVVAGLGHGWVTRIVLNAALVPVEGGAGIDCMQPRHAKGLRMVLGSMEDGSPPITTPGPPADPEHFRRTYGGDPLDDDTLAFVVDPLRCVADTVHHYFQPVCWSAVAGVPITYIVNDRDRPIPTDAQNEMAARLPEPTTVAHLDAGHIPAVTMPERFVALIDP